MKSNKVKKQLGLSLVALMFTAMLLAIISALVVNAQTETNYAVQSEPDPLADSSNRVGLTSDPPSNARTQDYTYEDISEEATGTTTDTLLPSSTHIAYKNTSRPNEPPANNGTETRYSSTDYTNVAASDDSRVVVNGNFIEKWGGTITLLTFRVMMSAKSLE